MADDATNVTLDAPACVASIDDWRHETAVDSVFADFDAMRRAIDRGIPLADFEDDDGLLP